MTQVYDHILEDLEAGELGVIERKVFEALKAHPEGLRREQLVAIVFGATVKAGGLKNNSSQDRKIRLAIAALRERMVPVTSSSAAAGYRLDTSAEGRRRMVADLVSRRDRLTNLINRAAKFYAPAETLPAHETAQQTTLL